MSDQAVPAALLERRRQLEERLEKLDKRIAGLCKLRDEIEGRGDGDAPGELYEELGSLLKSSADTVEHLKDTYRETVVLMYERDERERAAGFGRKREGHVTVALQAPVGLESKELEEIVFVLRTKQKWTWQQCVDWLLEKGVTKKRGGTNWHTSDVYAIHKKGFSPSRD